MFNIYWSPHAKESYAAILTFVVDNYSVDAGLNLDDKVERLLSNLEQNKHLCPPSDISPHVRRCVITKYLSLAYKVTGLDIELIAFFDNRALHGF